MNAIAGVIGMASLGLQLAAVVLMARLSWRAGAKLFRTAMKIWRRQHVRRASAAG